ncbi:GNAT family N-acetyltransferase [Amycolatopsis cihanbeyliensis]|uniref:Acetyltransferase (GNAT) family protein n=1 Tax=Amycolatopsis cihanbeyliensis TaxID=1128664 RepID=A0A542CTB5_AMYCI|nr:GNAT family N-acetyltransferase [Amycolatopsis cihanbeyliensis]TQI94030.1 acetyltransferase (GNAT) family protein [Amycolatopsis cihanbeyliensis]
MSTAQVRSARTDDAAEIGRIQRDTWRAAYTDILGASVLDRLDAEDVERQWADAVAHPETGVYLAFEGEFPVGFCVAGPAPEPEVASADGDLPADAARTGLIGTILVEPRWGRRGHGGRLLVAAATGLREQGAERGITWVAQSDSASLAFFRSVGWNPDGTMRTLDTGERTVRELRLTGDLALHLTE